LFSASGDTGTVSSIQFLEAFLQFTISRLLFFQESIARRITVVAKLAKSFDLASIPKVLATFATAKSDTYFPNDAKFFGFHQSLPRL